MTKYLDPSLERYERKVGPKDGNETVEKKCDQPAIVPKNFRKLDLPLIEHINAGCNQSEIKPGVQRTSLFQR